MSDWLVNGGVAGMLEYGGVITVESDSSGGTNAISCSGAGVMPVLSVSPASLDFSNQPVGVPRTRDFQVVNIGKGILSETASAGSPFAIIGSNSLYLSVGQTGVVAIAFIPPSPGIFSSLVVFTSNGGCLTNAVTGAGIGVPSFTNVASGIAVAQTPLMSGVNPGGLPTSMYFEYGPTPSYGRQTASVDLPASYTTTNASITVTGLTAGLLYHYRVVTSNALGVVTGPDLTFVTSGVVPGDLNGDGIIDQTELDGILSNYWPNAVLYMTNFIAYGEGRFSVQLPNPGAWSFTVQATTNFMSWTNVAPADPAHEFTDPVSTNDVYRFYRLRWP